MEKVMTVKMKQIDIDNLEKLHDYYLKERHIDLKDSSLVKMMMADYLMLIEKVELNKK